jgi:hypothetical protein
MRSSSRERGHQALLLVLSKVALAFVVFPQLPHLSTGVRFHYSIVNCHAEDSRQSSKLPVYRSRRSLPFVPRDGLSPLLLELLNQKWRYLIEALSGKEIANDFCV